MVDVLVIVVTYNSSKVITPLLRALPDALAEVPRVAVVLVDNGSSDATLEHVRQIAPWVRTIDSGGNLGYSAGINLGLKSVSATRGVYILNPDTIPAPGSVRHLLHALDVDVGTGIAVPLIKDADGALQCSLRREPSIIRAAATAVLGGRITSRIPGLGEELATPSRYVDGAVADWATGAAMLISPAAIAAVGTWDEQFFLYSEETDYALRVRDCGLHLRLVTAACVQHTGGDLNRSADLWALMAVNRVKVYRKRHGPVATAAFWAAVVTNEAIRSVMGGTTNRAALAALLGRREVLRAA